MHPDNLLIAESGVIKLGDFGLTTPLEHCCSLRDTDHVASRYMAPEVREGKAELKSDVWSLGVTMVELAEGKQPYSNKTTMGIVSSIITGNPPSISSSKWSTQFVDFVSKCCIKDVNERWSVRDLMKVN